MGFFSKLFGVKQASPQTPIIGKLEISTSFSSHYVEVRQKTPGTLQPAPLDAWDGYVSPSGGFIDYGVFQVIGKNPETKRKNKRTYRVRDKDAACKKAEENGLVGPFEITVLPADPPTEGQLAYAKDLGASIPDGACKTDVSAIISRITDDDESPASEELARAAFQKGINISRYHGRTEIMNIAKALPLMEYTDFLLSIGK